MATLREYFAKDFNRLLNVFAQHEATNRTTGKTVALPVRVHMDFDACAKFVSIYVPDGIDPASITTFYANDILQALKIADSVEVQVGFVHEPLHTKSPDLVFTGRLFVYAEREPAEESLALLKEYCQQKGLSLVFRSTSYRNERNLHEHPLAFISHDSRDKKEVAEPIAIGLQTRMCPVWYDEYSLKVGDSLRESIERGIKDARTCIVVLSQNFFSNNGWTKAEFDSIYTREIIEKKRVMLPVWHGVDQRQVYDYSLRLADRFGVNTALGIDAVVEKLHRAIKAAEIDREA
jgi:hypothetical protein